MNLGEVSGIFLLSVLIVEFDDWMKEEEDNYSASQDIVLRDWLTDVLT